MHTELFISEIIMHRTSASVCVGASQTKLHRDTHQIQIRFDLLLSCTVICHKCVSHQQKQQQRDCTHFPELHPNESFTLETVCAQNQRNIIKKSLLCENGAKVLFMRFMFAKFTFHTRIYGKRCAPFHISRSTSPSIDGPIACYALLALLYQLHAPWYRITSMAKKKFNFSAFTVQTFRS